MRETIKMAENECIIGSDATRHITSERAVFIRMELTTRIVAMANSERLRAQCLGDIRVSIDDEGIQMTDVLYVSGLNANLLSMSAFSRKSLFVHFIEQQVKIRRGSKIEITSIVKDRLYVLHIFHTALASCECETGDAEDVEDVVKNDE